MHFFPVWLRHGIAMVVPVVKNPPAYAGDTRVVGLIPGLGRSSGVGNGNALQDSCLKNSMGRGAWRWGHRKTWLSMHARKIEKSPIYFCNLGMKWIPGIDSGCLHFIESVMLAFLWTESQGVVKSPEELLQTLLVPSQPWLNDNPLL